jgi:PAS domain S-box-containing protein
MNDPERPAAERDYERKLREMNEALLISSVRQHELTEQAQKAEVRYRRLFESAKEGILILDAASGKVIDANPFMSELLGYSHDEFLGKELWEIGQFRDKSASEAAVRELQEKGYIRYEHLPLETNRGQRVEVEVVANVYREDHENVIQCSIRDITERRQLERTKIQAEALSDLHRRKDEFLAMLSHELRNPLAPIMNAVQLLRSQQGNESSMQQHARTIIERQVGQLAHLVDDLLEVSRVTTGRIHLQQELLDLRAVVERAVETVRPLIGRHQHILTVRLPPEPVWLNGDALRLEQVVVNLLNNAAKYSQDKGAIWLGLQQDRDEAVLRVRDAGVGIAPEVLPRIFDLFTQAERSLDRSQGGLGIGLTLVRQLTNLHGGRVEASSVLGQGSEFVVRLPVVRTPASQRTVIPAEVAQPTKSLRVLVVDDNKDQAESVAILARMSGHDVRTAHDGPTALQATDDYRPDVLLLDIGLPGLDGYEVAKRIREHPTRKNIVLVAMTGYGQETDRQRSQEAGFDHHLVKPVDFGKVREILATLTKRLSDAERDRGVGGAG